MSKVQTGAKKPPKRKDVLSRPAKPHVWFDPKCKEKLDLMVSLAPKEIGWEYAASREPSGDFVVHDCIAPKNQSVSPGTFEYEEKDHGEAIDTMILNGAFDIDKGEPIRGNWGLGHSHVNMGAFSSSTDEDQMMEYYDKGDPFAIQTVHNKKGDMYVAIFDFENGHYYAPEDLTWGIMSLLSDEEYDDLAERVKSATTKTYKSPYSRNSNYGAKSRESRSGQQNMFYMPKWMGVELEHEDTELVEVSSVDPEIAEQASKLGGY